jgi:hypothetical protein
MVKDIFHELVKTALVKDNWQITHDPTDDKTYQTQNIYRFGCRKIACCRERQAKNCGGGQNFYRFIFINGLLWGFGAIPSLFFGTETQIS